MRPPSVQLHLVLSFSLGSVAVQVGELLVRIPGPMVDGRARLLGRVRDRRRCPGPVRRPMAPARPRHRVRVQTRRRRSAEPRRPGREPRRTGRGRVRLQGQGSRPRPRLRGGGRLGSAVRPQVEPRRRSPAPLGHDRFGNGAGRWARPRGRASGRGALPGCASGGGIDDARDVVDVRQWALIRQARRHLLRERSVALGALGVRVVDGDRLPEPGRLGEPDGPRDDRLVDPIPEVPPDLGDDLLGELGPRIEHRHDDAGQAQPGVHVLLDEPDVAEQLAQPLQRVVLALDRHEELLGGGERVHGQQAERGRAVQEHEVEGVLLERLDGLLQPQLARELAHELDLGAGEVDRGGDRDRLSIGVATIAPSMGASSASTS